MIDYKDIFHKELKPGHFYIEMANRKYDYFHIIKFLDIKEYKGKGIDYMLKNSLLSYDMHYFYLNNDRDKVKRSVISTQRYYYIPLTQEFEELINKKFPGVLKYD